MGFVMNQRVQAMCEEMEIMLLLYTLWKKLNPEFMPNSLLIVPNEMSLSLLNNRLLLRSDMRSTTELI